MKSIKQTQQFAKRMIEDNSQLVAKREALDRMWRNDWNLPTEMSNQPFIYKAVDSSPSDALDTAVRSFSANHPKPTIVPLSSDPDDKATANKIERGLMWEYWNADKRSETRLTPDGMRSALRYDEVCIQVTHLPHHYDSIKAAYENLTDENVKMERLDALEKRRKAALRKGDFIISVRNPIGVYHRYSELGLESVLLVQEMRAGDIVALWENLASTVRDDKDKEWEDKTWIYFDFQSLEQRSVWVSDSAETVESKKVILHEKNDLPFISWAIRTGGSAIDAQPEHRSTPYLNNVYTAKSWELSNTLKTLSVSEVIKYSGGPRVVTKTTGGEGIEIEYGGDQASLDLKTHEDAQPWNPPAIDRAVMETYDRERAAMDAQTRVRVLMNPNFPGGTAFATINALMQSALDGLQPWRELAEYAFMDMFELMLLWVDYTERPIKSYGRDGADNGTQYLIEKGDFSVENIFLSVELSGDVPTDRVERINSAVMLFERLGWSKEKVMTDLGEQDPQGVIKERAFEDMVDAEIQNMIQQRQALAQMQFQQLMAAMQQGGGQPEGGDEEQPYQESAPQNPALDQMQGQGFDAAMGGMATQAAVPGMGREQITGMDAEGQPLAV